MAAVQNLCCLHSSAGNLAALPRETGSGALHLLQRLLLQGLSATHPPQLQNHQHRRDKLVRKPCTCPTSSPNCCTRELRVLSNSSGHPPGLETLITTSWVLADRDGQKQAGGQGGGGGDLCLRPTHLLVPSARGRPTAAVILKLSRLRFWPAAERLESLSATTRGTRGRSLLFVCFFVVAFFFLPGRQIKSLHPTSRQETLTGSVRFQSVGALMSSRAVFSLL